MKKLTAMVGALMATAVFWTPAQEARAEFVTGNTLYRWCTGADHELSPTIQSMLCLGYIQGAHDGLEAGAQHVTVRAELDDPYLIVCVPARVEAGQLEEIVVAHLRANPADRNLSASVLVYAALTAAYAC